MTIHIDIGGEGAYPGAINVNPNRLRSTTGVPGTPIPNLVQGVGERLPFADGVATRITVEHAPLRAGAVHEIARVLAPGGSVLLRHPIDYAVGDGIHDAVRAALEPGIAGFHMAEMPDQTIQTVVRRAVDLLR